MAHEALWDAGNSMLFTPCNPSQAKYTIKMPVVHDFQNLQRIKSKSPGKHTCSPTILGPLNFSVSLPGGNSAISTNSKGYYGAADKDYIH